LTTTDWILMNVILNCNQILFLLFFFSPKSKNPQNRFLNHIWIKYINTLNSIISTTKLHYTPQQKYTQIIYKQTKRVFYRVYVRCIFFLCRITRLQKSFFVRVTVKSIQQFLLYI
jgi:hypothetical protein